MEQNGQAGWKGLSNVETLLFLFLLSVPENSTTLAILYKTNASRNNS